MRRVALITVLLVAAAYSTPSTYNCLWKDPKGNNYDLTPLKSETQDYSAPYDKYTFIMNVCTSLVQFTCLPGATDVGSCQSWSTGKAILGLTNTVKWLPAADTSGENGDGVSLHFTGGSAPVDKKKREFQIDFVCDTTVKGTGTPKFSEEKDTNPETLVYFFQWRTPYACPVVPSSNIEHGLSGGSIFLIITASAYFVGGLLFMKFARHAEGVNMIPNIEFWASLPGLVKDGVKYVSAHTIGKITGRSGYSAMP